MIQIPLLTEPAQSFSIVIGEEEYNFRVIYNAREETFSMDISGTDFEIGGINLVGGCDILKQYSIPIENMFVIDLTGEGTDPTIDNLGVGNALVIATDAELIEATS